MSSPILDKTMCSVLTVVRTEHAPLSLFTPADLRRAEERGELDFDANLLNLRPDPVHFVRFLKAIDRTDVSSDLFVKLLEDYREARVEGDTNPMRLVNVSLGTSKLMHNMTTQYYALPPAYNPDADSACRVRRVFQYSQQTGAHPIIYKACVVNVRH